MGGTGARAGTGGEGGTRDAGGTEAEGRNKDRGKGQGQGEGTGFEGQDRDNIDSFSVCGYLLSYALQVRKRSEPKWALMVEDYYVVEGDGKLICITLHLLRYPVTSFEKSSTLATCIASYCFVFLVLVLYLHLLFAE